MSEIKDDDVVPTTVKQDLIVLDNVFDKTQARREEVINKLSSVISGMEISTNDAKVIGAQMSIVNTYLNVLNGQEGNIARRVGSKLKQLETETVSKHSSAVADLLSRVSLNGTKLNISSVILDPSVIEKQVDEAFELSGLPPILTTELKMDPNDLHE